MCEWSTASPRSFRMAGMPRTTTTAPWRLETAHGDVVVISTMGESISVVLEISDHGVLAGAVLTAEETEKVERALRRARTGQRS